MCGADDDDGDAFPPTKTQSAREKNARLDLGSGDVARLDGSLELLVLALEVLQARLGRLDRLLQRLELLQLLRGRGDDAGVAGESV
jgi:hypothetical protein